MIFDVLLRFRAGNIGLTADAEKAYLQISIAAEDRDYLRVLWFDDVSKVEPEIIKCRYARVLFGARPSQFILNSVIKKHVEKYEDMDPDFVAKILSHLYVDDLNAVIGNYFYKKAKLRFTEAK